MFTVKDTKGEIFLSPFFLNATGLACRSFAETANDPQSMICRYPDDYTLFEIGYFDDQTGEVVNEDPHNLGAARTYQKAVPHHPDQMDIEDAVPSIHHLSKEI